MPKNHLEFEDLNDDPDYRAVLEQFDRKNEEIIEKVLERDVYQ